MKPRRSATNAQPETPIPVAPHAALTVIQQVHRRTGLGALVMATVLSMTAIVALIVASASAVVAGPALLTGVISGVPATWLLVRGMRSSKEAAALRQAKALGPTATGELLGRSLIMRDGRIDVTLHLTRSECNRIRQLALPQAVATIAG